jgi:hypothetical protein
VLHHDFRHLFSHPATLELQIVIKTFNRIETSAAKPQPSRIDSRKAAKTAKETRKDSHAKKANLSLNALFAIRKEYALSLVARLLRYSLPYLA